MLDLCKGQLLERPKQEDLKLNLEESMRLFIMSVLLAGMAAPAAAQEQPHRPDRVINVNATGTVQREPEKAVITVAVESDAATAQAAATANARKMEGVFAALRRAGIVPPKVRTIAYEMHPVYAPPTRDNPNPAPRVVGYRALNMVLVEVDTIARVGPVIDATVSSGANRIHNLSFELRDSEAARLEALKLATAKARNEAEVLAAATGQRLGPPVSISSSSHFEPRQYRMEAQMRGDVAMAPPPTPIEAGTLTITATVNIVYRMEDR
jgi:uncharacterized protein YggE